MNTAPRTLLFRKSHVSGYTRSDGTYVQAHEDKRLKRGRKVIKHSSLAKFDDAVLDSHMKHDGSKESSEAITAAVRESKSIAHGMDRYHAQEGNSIDLIVWHGTSAKNLKRILSEGLQPQTTKHGRSRDTDIGKVFIAADKQDARSFAIQALADQQHDNPLRPAVAILLAIRLPAEARESVEWMQNGIDSFADVRGGVPPEWILGYQRLVSIKDADVWKSRYNVLHKSEEDPTAGANRFVVFLCSGDDGVLAKAHIKGYLRSDGTFVPDHDDKREPKKPPMITALLGGHKSWPSKSHQPAAPVKAPPKAYHPKPGSKGEKIGLYNPHTDGAPEAWLGPDHTARVTPGGWLPKSLNGIPFVPWADAPKTLSEWESVPGQKDDLDEPPMHVGLDKHAAAGVVIEEPDGRVWLIHPSNGFGGYKATYPKGTIEDDEDLSPQAVAIKEAFEESGLKVEITGYLMDVERSTSVCRYYRARRVGGSPADCGWESQAVSLVPKPKLYSALDRDVNHPLAAMVGAGPLPKKPQPVQSSGWGKPPSSPPVSASSKPAAAPIKSGKPPLPFGNKKQGSLF